MVRTKYCLLNCALLVLFVTFCDVDAQVTPKKGLKLANHVVDTVTVGKPMECVLKCVEHYNCLSINYKDTGTTTNICELNSKNDCDVALTPDSEFDFYGPKNNHCEDTCSSVAPGKCESGGKCALLCPATGLHTCECPHGKGGDTCTEINEYNLKFPRGSIEDYMLLESNFTDTENFTVLFWINILSTTGVAAFSYGVNGSNQELLVVLDKDTLVLTVQTHFSRAFNIPPVNDGFWHHIGIARNQTLYSIFLDGVLLHSVNDFGTSAALKGKGIFVLGQKMNNRSNFDVNLALKGRLNQFNMWSSVLGREVIESRSRTCSANPGEIVDWLLLKAPLSGEVSVERSPNCMSLRNDSDYNVIMSAPSTTTAPTYAISPEETTSDITAFTISLWVKHTSSFDDFDQYVSYATAIESALRIFREHNGRLVLHFGAGNATSINVPPFQHESPPYWHHLATTWNSLSGLWKIFLDGSMVAYAESIFPGHVIPKGGKFVIGNIQTSLESGMTVEDSFSGSLSRVNIWDFDFDGTTIWLMSTLDIFLANGNLFSWFGIKGKSFGDVVFETMPLDHYNSRSDAEYELEFSERSTTNYVRYGNVFPNNISVFTMCFWARVETAPACIVDYRTEALAENSELMVYAASHKLYISVAGNTTFLRYGSSQNWHFYCFKWRSTHGKLGSYIDGFFKTRSTISVGKVINSGGTFLVGQHPDGYVTGFDLEQSFVGSIAQFNVWGKYLDHYYLKGMASGIMNINGDLLQWREFKNHIVGDVTVVTASVLRLPDFPVQKKRDQFCSTNHRPCNLARHTAINDNHAYVWRCINITASSNGGMIYDLPLMSNAQKSGLNAILINVN